MDKSKLELINYIDILINEVIKHENFIIEETTKTLKIIKNKDIIIVSNNEKNLYSYYNDIYKIL